MLEIKILLNQEIAEIVLEITLEAIQEVTQKTHKITQKTVLVNNTIKKKPLLLFLYQFI